MQFSLKHFPALLIAILLIHHSPVKAQIKPSPDQSAAGIEFFEKRIRPVLSQQCYECHSHAAKKSYGNLYLDNRNDLLKKTGNSAPISLEAPEKSRLIEALKYTNLELQMPPKGKLAEGVIADFIEWAKRGAPWPQEGVSPAVPTGKEPISAVELKKRKHWAWQPVRNPQPPAVKRKAWAHNPIDKFILAGLEAKGMSPSDYADRRTLIRRASFDLVGLPPSPEEVDAFLKDKSPNAWEKVIDRLLSSPHYGERWGRFWLDIARYGEDQAHNFEARLYPQGFRYRDWVANAFNTDMPYDKFIKRQIAADLIDEPGKQEHLAALGYFALGPVYYADEKMFDQYDDRVDTLSRGFLGLTVACARCHDHKFDPISQKEYYGLAGVFSNSLYTEIPIEAKSSESKTGDSPDRRDKLKAKQTEVEEFVKSHVSRIRKELTPEISKYLVAVWTLREEQKTDPKTTIESVSAKSGLSSLFLERWVKYLAKADDKERPILREWRKLQRKGDVKTDLSSSPSSLAEARETAGSLQNYLQSLVTRKEASKLEKDDIVFHREVFGDEGVLTLPEESLEKFLSGDPKMRYAVIKLELERLKNSDYIHALKESPKFANLPLLIRGNQKTPGEEAPRRFLAILSGDKSQLFQNGSGRLELANSIADKRNPITARLMVNRIWQRHFGVGIVRTTSNFGLLGDKPSNSQLLDYLASQFMAQGWSVKTLHKQIMLSASYQMSGVNIPKYELIDPDNRLVWRMNQRKLEIEAWRDSMLAVTGKLDRKIGGPSLSLSSLENCRRTFYAAVSRHDLDPMLRLFDFPDPNVTADSRSNTTVPLQQLFVLNSEFMIKQGKDLAARLTSDASETDSIRIKKAFLILYNRLPAEAELRIGLAFLGAVKTSYPPVAHAKIAEVSAPSPADTSRLTRWERYAQVLLSSNEFLFID